VNFDSTVSLDALIIAGSIIISTVALIVFISSLSVEVSNAFKEFMLVWPEVQRAIGSTS